MTPMTAAARTVRLAGVASAKECAKRLLSHVRHPVRLPQDCLFQTYLAGDLRSSLNEVKGKSAPSPSPATLGVDYKTSFVLTHKLREAMGEEMRGRVVGG